LVSALCDGYASEIGDRWSKEGGKRVFAFLDVRTMSISLRRSPDCDVDLSQLARRLGGGGHPAAAGCSPAHLPARIAGAVAALVAEASTKR
ncbi:MAG TPA: DHHA1 domain-containing protein, partial [Candidatus Acidoferrales bacterium]|nr:DHHA1 domain-containing protein [Candidatus Acidoferrales bacterium]